MGEQPRLLVVAGLVWLGPARLLVQRRPPDAAHGAGALELPGGKVERGEGPRAALARELREEWGEGASALGVGAIVDALHHVYPAPGPEVHLLVFDVDGAAWGARWRDHVRPAPGLELAAHDLRNLPVHEFLDADRPFLEALRARAD